MTSDERLSLFKDLFTILNKAKLFVLRARKSNSATYMLSNNMHASTEPLLCIKSNPKNGSQIRLFQPPDFVSDLK